MLHRKFGLAGWMAASLALSPIACQQAPNPPTSDGYVVADLKDPEVKAAQKVAVDAIYEQDPQRGTANKVIAKKRQVAGTFYAFDIKMSGPGQTALPDYRVTVYKSPEGEMRVVIFEKMKF